MKTDLLRKRGESTPSEAAELFKLVETFTRFPEAHGLEPVFLDILPQIRSKRPGLKLCGGSSSLALTLAVRRPGGTETLQVLEGTGRASTPSVTASF